MRRRRTGPGVSRVVNLVLNAEVEVWRKIQRLLFMFRRDLFLS